MKPSQQCWPLVLMLVLVVVLLLVAECGCSMSFDGWEDVGGGGVDRGA